MYSKKLILNIAMTGRLSLIRVFYLQQEQRTAKPNATTNKPYPARKCQPVSIYRFNNYRVPAHSGSKTKIWKMDLHFFSLVKI